MQILFILGRVTGLPTLQRKYSSLPKPSFSSLPLRFFVNIIKNPDFIFDVQKTNVIDASLSVIAQMFMDSCAAGTHQLTKDSPSSKLLFYRDVQKYKKLVEKFV
jgi:plexin A